MSKIDDHFDRIQREKTSTFFDTAGDFAADPDALRLGVLQLGVEEDEVADGQIQFVAAGGSISGPDETVSARRRSVNGRSRSFWRSEAVGGEAGGAVGVWL